MSIGSTGPFWTLSPYINPDSLYGGVRKRTAAMHGVNADGFRSATQSQQVGQAASSHSGAAATNDQSQNAQVSQDVTAVNTKYLEVNSHAQTLFTPEPYYDEDTGARATASTELNKLEQSDGTNYFNADHLLVAGDLIYITGDEYDGSSIGTKTFIYGTAGDATQHGNANGTTLGELVDFVNGVGAGTDGNVDKFTTGTLELLTGPEDKGILKLRADMGGPGDMAIDIDAPPRHVTTQTFSRNPVGNAPVAEVARTGQLLRDAAAGGGNALSTTPINDLAIAKNFVDAGGDVDEINISGRDANGNVINGVFKYGAEAGEHGTTLGDLADRIEALFNTGANDVTVDVVDGRLVMTADGERAVAPDLSFEISDGAGSGEIQPRTSSVFTQGEDAVQEVIRNTFTHKDGAGNTVDENTDLVDLTFNDDNDNPLNPGDLIRVQGTRKDGTVSFDVYFTYGAGQNGTTLGDLRKFLDGTGGGPNVADRFPDSTVAVTSGDPSAVLTITEDVASNGPTDLALTLSDAGKHIDFQDFTGPDRLPMFGLHALNDLGDLLARGAAKLVQDQGGDQSAMAKLNDFEGDDSTAFNRVSQTAQGTQTFDVDLTTTVYNCTLANNDGSAWNAARFRSIEALDNLNVAQAIFTSGQRQGHTQDPLTQVAVADGADADNTLAQTATISQTGEVTHTGRHIMTRNETAPLMPRSTDLLAQIQDNASVNSSAAAQEQALVQSGAGGTDEAGNVTENDGTAQNLGGSRAINTDEVEVLNSISIII